MDRLWHHTKPRKGRPPKLQHQARKALIRGNKEGTANSKGAEKLHNRGPF